MKRALLIASTLALLCLFSIVTVKDVSAYSIITLDAPGATATNVKGINNNGSVVGNFSDATGSHSFMYNGTTYSTLDAPGEAYGINDSGSIVGTYWDTSGSHGYMYNGTSYSTLDAPSAVDTMAYGINNAGIVAGAFTDSNNQNYFRYGYTYDGSTYSTIYNSSAVDNGNDVRAINNTGSVVGSYYYMHEDFKGFIYDGVTYLELKNTIPYVIYTLPNGINDEGMVVGKIRRWWNDWDNHSFIYDGSNFIMFDINLLGVTRTDAYGINNMGCISGSYFDPIGTHGFIAIPELGDPTYVPEPSTMFLFSAGLAGLGLMRKRFKV